MRYYEARSTIAASAEAVWAVLIDGASWPKWDSGVDAVEGRIAAVCSLRGLNLRRLTLGRSVRRRGAGGRRSGNRPGQLATAAEAKLVVVLVFFAAAVAGNHRDPR